jgi:hypothetical protein
MQNNDGVRPLGPLTPEVISHLNTTVGPAEPFITPFQGTRDKQATGWLVGRGHVETPFHGGVVRTLDVEIRLTRGGTLIVTRISRSSGNGSNSADSDAKPCETPNAAYEWLLKDGKGKLGPASKAAWVRACRTVPGMSGLEFERID